MPLRPRTLRLFSAFSPLGSKGCSKDDERVLKGCLCLCHPSHNLFFRRKHLHGTILFRNFLQRYNKYLKYTRILAIKCNFICILCYKALLFAQLCDCIFGGFLIYKGVPKIQQIFVYYFF